MSCSTITLKDAPRPATFIRNVISLFQITGVELQSSMETQMIQIPSILLVSFRSLLVQSCDRSNNEAVMIFHCNYCCRVLGS